MPGCHYQTYCIGYHVCASWTKLGVRVITLLEFILLLVMLFPEFQATSYVAISVNRSETLITPVMRERTTVWVYFQTGTISHITFFFYGEWSKGTTDKNYNAKMFCCFISDKMENCFITTVCFAADLSCNCIRSRAYRHRQDKSTRRRGKCKNRKPSKFNYFQTLLYKIIFLSAFKMYIATLLLKFLGLYPNPHLLQTKSSSICTRIGWQ